MKCPKCKEEMEDTIQLGSPKYGWYCSKCKIDYDERGDEIC